MAGEPMVKVVLTMPAADAARFIEDWSQDPNAPVLTGGWLENSVHVEAAERLEGEVV